MIVFYSIIGLGLFILQIVMITKFFEIASNVRRIASQLDHQSGEEFSDAPAESMLNPSTDLSAISYKENGSTIIFSTGKSGQVAKSFGEYKITTKNGVRFFDLKEQAIDALKKDIH